jgi:hypothetical protein
MSCFLLGHPPFHNSLNQLCLKVPAPFSPENKALVIIIIIIKEAENKLKYKNLSIEIQQM